MEIVFKVVKNGDCEVVVDVTKDDGLNHSDYAFTFDEHSAYWMNDKEMNLFFLRSKQNYANDLLRARGHLFLNEIYDMLGVARTKFGQCVGWIYDPGNPNIDNYVDFFIHNNFDDPDDNTFILDPNVDGIILDRI